MIDAMFITALRKCVVENWLREDIAAECSGAFVHVLKSQEQVLEK
jgi:hypothetical protein